MLASLFGADFQMESSTMLLSEMVYLVRSSSSPEAGQDRSLPFFVVCRTHAQ